MVSAQDAIFNYFQNNMKGPAMKFLHAGTDSRSDNPFRIGEALELAPSPPRHNDRLHLPLFGRFQGKDQIGGITARGKKDENVSRLTEGIHLPGKNLVEAKIVADAGERRSIRREGNGWQGATVVFITPDQFFRQMECIGGTASITGGKDFSTRQKNFRDELGAAIHPGQGLPGIGNRLNEFGILLLDDGIHNVGD